jgi:heme-degrading monooxygenase HmoA
MRQPGVLRNAQSTALIENVFSEGVSSMFARIGTFSGPAERVDDEATRRARQQMLQKLLTIPGFAGLYVFADRKTGKTIGISLWETEAAANDWEQMRTPLVAERAGPAGHTEQESATYELLFSSTAQPTFVSATT